MLALYVVALLMTMIVQGDASSLDPEGKAAVQLLEDGKTDAVLDAINETPELITWAVPDSKRTLLFISVLTGNFDMAKVLIERGADVDALDSSGYGPIHEAALKELSLVQLLVENGVDPTLPAYTEHTPLIPAVRRGSTENIRYLIKMGFPANAVSVKMQVAPLHFAVSMKSLEKMVALLEAGVDINVVKNNGNTAANMLAAKKSEDLTMLHTLLFDYCPDLTIANNDGKTPLDTAMEMSLEANALLIQEKLNNTCSFEDVYYPLEGLSYQDCMEYVCLPNCTWNATGNEDPSCTETDAPETADANIPMDDAAAVPAFAVPQGHVVVMVNQNVHLGDRCDSC